MLFEKEIFTRRSNRAPSVWHCGLIGIARFSPLTATYWPKISSSLFSSSAGYLPAFLFGYLRRRRSSNGSAFLVSKSSAGGSLFNRPIRFFVIGAEDFLFFITRRSDFRAFVCCRHFPDLCIEQCHHLRLEDLCRLFLPPVLRITWQFLVVSVPALRFAP